MNGRKEELITRILASREATAAFQNPASSNNEIEGAEVALTGGDDDLVSVILSIVASLANGILFDLTAQTTRRVRCVFSRGCQQISTLSVRFDWSLGGSSTEPKAPRPATSNTAPATAPLSAAAKLVRLAIVP